MAGLLLVCLTLAAVCSLATADLNCTNYPQEQCQPDTIPFCLTNGTLILGTCDALRAVCGENSTVDDTGNACNDQTTPPSQTTGSGQNQPDGDTATHQAASAILVVASILFHLLRTCGD